MNTVKHLRGVNFRVLPLEEKLKIKTMGRPLPDLKISQTVSSRVSGSQSSSNGAKTSSKTNGVVQNALLPTTRTGPMIDKVASKNVTALLGKTAYLNCKVKNLGNKTVSWVRHRDIHLLTVGRYTYTSDQRFRAIHHQSSEDWSLQIKYPQHRDTGIYECQISTTPHMSHFIHLNVVEPTTDIIGGPDLYIDRGSTINLTCVVLYSPEPPAYIFWNHNDAIISYDSPRGGVSVITEKGETTTSFLLIQQARPSDSGRYQCNPSNAQSKSINVHVLNEFWTTPSVLDAYFPYSFPTESSTEYLDITDYTEFTSESTPKGTTDDSTTDDTTDESTTDVSTTEVSTTNESATDQSTTDESTTTSGGEEPTTKKDCDCCDCNRSHGFRSKHTTLLLLLGGLMAQFPAAMQHGGQAHHRSSHLYCLIFCVCLLLFST